MDGTTQTGGGSGSGGGTPQGGGSQGGTTVVVQGAAAGSKTERRADAVQGIVDRLVSKFGTLENALNVLAGENFEHRETIRTQNDELVELRKKVPADGTLVLTADQRKSWEAIVATGVPIDKVAERVKRAGELETAANESSFAQLVEQGAAAVNFNPTVLKSLLKDKGYTLEQRDMLAADGKTTIKVPFIRKANDEKAAWEKLDVAAERDFKDYLPALKTLPQGGGSGSGGGNNASGQGTATHAMPSQSSASASQGGGGGGSVVDQQLDRAKKRSERPNPLKPAPAKT